MSSPSDHTPSLPALDKARRPREQTELGHQLAPALIAGGAFLCVQSVLALYNAHLLQAAARLGFTPESAVHRVAVAIAVNAVVYGVLVAVETVLVSRGYGVASVAPVIVLVLLPAILAPLGAHVPEPIGTEWQPECLTPCASALRWILWLGALVDISLVLAPAATAARRVGSLLPRKRIIDGPTVAAFVVGVFAAFLVYRTARILGMEPNVSAFVAAAAYGFMAGTSRRGWPWAHAAFASIAGGFLPQALSQLGLQSFSRTSTGLAVGVYWLYVATALAVSPWELISAWLEEVRDRPLLLLVAANALNVADALMTWDAIEAGNAVEVNPIVRLIGLPLKLIVVALFTWIIFVKRPRSLLWPVVGLGLVLGYHLSGLVVNA